MVLPPMADPASLDDNSYFWKKRVDLRSAIAASSGIVKPLKGEPLIVRLWRFYHDEAMLDLFREGAIAEVNVGDGIHATVSVGLAANSDRTASWRRRFLLNPETVPGPSWARDVAAAISGDLRDAASGAGDSDLEVSFAASKRKAITENVRTYRRARSAKRRRKGCGKSFRRLAQACRRAAPNAARFSI